MYIPTLRIVFNILPAGCYKTHTLFSCPLALEFLLMLATAAVAAVL